jgi:hypothetical protein
MFLCSCPVCFGFLPDEKNRVNFSMTHAKVRAAGLSWGGLVAADVPGIRDAGDPAINLKENRAER